MNAQTRAHMGVNEGDLQGAKWWSSTASTHRHAIKLIAETESPFVSIPPFFAPPDPFEWDGLFALSYVWGEKCWNAPLCTNCREAQAACGSQLTLNYTGIIRRGPACPLTRWLTARGPPRWFVQWPFSCCHDALLSTNLHVGLYKRERK